MKKAVIAAVVSVTLMGASATNNMAMASTDNASSNTDTHQLVGMGSGAALGAVVGGPAGAVIGAIVGGLVGTSSGLEADSQMQADQIALLSEEKAALEGVRRQYQLAQRDNAQLRESLQSRHLEPVPLNLNVQFQTGSYELAPHYQAQLDTVADMMADSEGQAWLIEGHADRNGEPKQNYVLSQRRADAVRGYLIQRGVEPSQLIVDAFGDTLPVMEAESLENNIYDRRVSISYMGMSTAKH